MDESKNPGWCNDPHRFELPCVIGNEGGEMICKAGPCDYYQETTAMPEPKHTPEPWTYTVAEIEDQFGRHETGFIKVDGHGGGAAMATCWGNGTQHESGRPNAARIVACVNALEGMNPEHIGELVEALEIIAGRGGVFDAKGTHAKRTAGIARDALSKLKGG